MKFRPGTPAADLIRGGKIRVMSPEGLTGAFLIISLARYSAALA
jgi:hypothetical protein